MSKWWMLTGPCTKPRFKRLLKIFVEANDVHEWAYCIEKGRKGYQHVHCKLKCNNGIGMDDLRHAFYNFHIESSNEDIGYLRKGGTLFVSSRDSPEVNKVKFGELLGWQKRLLEHIDKQEPREITVVIDTEGGLGKSWLAIWLFENGLAFFVPPVLNSPKEIIQFICSGIKEEKLIVVDIPRSWKWTDQLVIALETVKDGLIFDARFASKWRNIRGTRVIVFANTFPDLNMLSKDRWDIVELPSTKKLMEEWTERGALS